MKIQKQAGLEAAKLEVGEELCLMHRQNLFDGLQFKNKTTLNQDVYLEAGLQPD
jgi:hypothetical protein